MTRSSNSNSTPILQVRVRGTSAKAVDHISINAVLEGTHGDETIKGF